jgi:hypothetical protein
MEPLILNGALSEMNIGVKTLVDPTAKPVIILPIKNWYHLPDVLEVV